MREPIGTQEEKLTDQGLRAMWFAVQLAQKMGALLARGSILLGTLSKKL